MLRNEKGEILGMFSKGVGTKDSKKAEVYAIFEALRIFSHWFQVYLIVGSNLRNTVAWVSYGRSGHGRASFASTI